MVEIKIDRNASEHSIKIQRRDVASSLRLRIGSGLGPTIRQETDGYMLCKQDPCRSSNKLHDDGKRAFGGRLRTREVPAVHLREQDRYLHRSWGLEILALQERG